MNFTKKKEYIYIINPMLKITGSSGMNSLLQTTAGLLGGEEYESETAIPHTPHKAFFNNNML